VCVYLVWCVCVFGVVCVCVCVCVWWCVFLVWCVCVWWCVSGGVCVSWCVVCFVCIYTLNELKYFRKKINQRHNVFHTFICYGQNFLVPGNTNFMKLIPPSHPPIFKSYPLCHNLDQKYTAIYSNICNPVNSGTVKEAVSEKLTTSNCSTFKSN
jgi:hypothetical protein